MAVPDPEWIQLTAVPCMAEAEILQALLRAAGIPSRLQYDAAGLLIFGPGEAPFFSKVAVLVPEAQKIEGEELLRRVEEEAGEPDEENKGS